MRNRRHAKKYIPAQRYYTTREVAEYAGVSTTTIHNDKKGELITPALSPGPGYTDRYTWPELREYLAYRGLAYTRDGELVDISMRMRRAVDKYGLEVAAHQFGIKTSSMRRNTYNWIKQGTWPLGRRK